MRTLCLILGLATCLTAAPKVTDWEAVGKYSAPGLESRRTLELREDNTYLMILCVRGSDLAQQKIEERGTWIIDGDVVTLTPENGKPYGPDIWYARLLLRKAGTKRELRVGVPGAFGYDRLALEETENSDTSEDAASTSPSPAEPAAQLP